MPLENPVDPIDPIDPGPKPEPVVAVEELARTDDYVLTQTKHDDVVVKTEMLTLTEAVDSDGNTVKIKGGTESVEAKKINERMVQIDVQMGVLQAEKDKWQAILDVIPAEVVVEPTPVEPVET